MISRYTPSIVHSKERKHIDLTDAAARAAQEKNTLVFRKRWLRTMLGVCFSFSIVSLSLAVGFNEVLSIILIMLCIGYTVISMFFYKCPECGTTPTGESRSMLTEVSYSKGIHPFPQRCECCNAYLSNKLLRKDIEVLNKNI